MTEKLTAYVRILLGLVYVINGLNWFYKIITPYPSSSDFVDYMPPPDVVGGMIEQGVLFQAAKATELIGGLLLLANRFVPLSLVASMAVTIPVFIVDVFRPELKLRSTLMGTGSLVMNTTLLIAYYHHLRPMVNWKAQATVEPATRPLEQGDAVAEALGNFSQKVQPVLTILSAILGTAMVIWLLTMVGQYIADPKPIYELYDLRPRNP